MKVKVSKLLGLVLILIFALSAANAAHAVGVTATIKVGGAPYGVAYDSGRAEVFVVNSSAGTVIVLSDSSYAVRATVTVGHLPYRDIYDSGQGEVFVANYGANSVSVISDKTNGVVATVPVGALPTSFAYDSAKGEVFVANSGAGSVSVISDKTNAVVATVPVGTGPYDLGYDSSKGEIFVANSYSRSVSVISDSSNLVVATISVGSGPLGTVYDSAKGEVFVANSVSGSVSVITDSNNSVVATTTVGTTPGATIYDPARGEVFVLNRGSASVSVISDSNNSVVATVAVGTNPYGADYDPAKGEIFVANEGDGTVSVISDSSAASGSTSSTASASTTTSGTVQTTSASSTQDIVQQVWVPKPANAVASVAVSAAIVGAASLIFAALSNPLGGVGGTVADKTQGVIPDNIRQWFEEVLSSRRKLEAKEKKGPLFRPTRPEIVAYIVSLIVLAVSFSYVKVVTLSQIWVLLPVFFATSFIVAFVQSFFSIVYMRRKGVWSEHVIWPLGLVLFLFTTFVFKVPFSSPTRDVNSKKFTEKAGAMVSASGVLISLAFAGLFFLLLLGGDTSVGGAGLSMCVLSSFFCTFPISPMSGKDIFDHSKRLWAALFIVTLVIFAAWLLLI
ncbi:MAG: YncE family protein [Nitrososphaerales archaeon]|jgi:YVTN family beta-propeller protein